MARPIEFDIDVALEKAMQQFWKDGFEASSIQKLLAAMGINRGSLYASFGDKETLYKRCLDLYEKQLQEHIDASLGTIEDPIAAIKAFFIPTRKMSKMLSYGCFLANASSEMSHLNPALAKGINKRLNQVETQLSQCVSQAQEQKLLRDDTSAADLASFLMSVRSGLCLRGRIGQRKNKLLGILDTAFKAVA